ncbi:DUF2599 domain-containing protein [Luteibacter sp. PPL201]|uniref:DUF2599 domain-containing protein n=2 Tax=Bacteria TaxID=2 RepID=A0ABT6BD95_9GAMM
MKASIWAVIGLTAACAVGVTAGVVRAWHRDAADPLRGAPHAATATPFAEPCDAATGEGYVQSGQWTLDTFGPVLEITPTDCGRNAGAARRDHLDMEVIEKFSGNVNWRNTRGLINQLDCHAINYPTKPTWNIEPDRPYVGYRLTWQAQCNPSTPRPDSPFE